MEGDVQMPVTLIVRTPNQKVADHTIECGLEWTIRKLKEHLSAVYPSKPESARQKLIYSGQLLKDDSFLKDIIRKPSEPQTVHLVCTQPPNSQTEYPSSPGHIPTAQSMHTNFAPQRTEAVPAPVATPNPETSGLRFRRTQTVPAMPSDSATLPAASAPSIPPVPPYASHAPVSPALGHYDLDRHPQYTQDYLQAQMQYLQRAYPGYTQQQIQMIQQQMSYMYQLANYGPYASYHHNMFGYMHATSPFGHQAASMPAQLATHVEETPAELAAGEGRAEAVHLPQPRQDAPPQRPPAPPQQPRDEGFNQVMNAQGGGEDDLGDDEPRDWLDWTYLMSRAGVLLAIIYFYSSLWRFVSVALMFLGMYLLQTAWTERARLLRLRRQQQQGHGGNGRHGNQDAAGANRNAGGNGEADAVQAEVLRQMDLQHGQEEEGANEEEGAEHAVGGELEPDSEDSDVENEVPGGATTAASENQTTLEATAAATANQDASAPQQRHGLATTAWSFVSGFFSSLIPANPNMLDQN